MKLTACLLAMLVLPATPLPLLAADEDPEVYILGPVSMGNISDKDSPGDDQDARRLVTVTSDGGTTGSRGSTYSVADILLVAGGGSVHALRTEIGGEPVFTFDLKDSPLMALLNALSLAMQIPLPQATPNVIAEDLAAEGRFVTLDVREVSLIEALDQAAIDSGCNIYLDGLAVVVDRCR